MLSDVYTCVMCLLYLDTGSNIPQCCCQLRCPHPRCSAQPARLVAFLSTRWLPPLPQPTPCSAPSALLRLSLRQACQLPCHNLRHPRSCTEREPGRRHDHRRWSCHRSVRSHRSCLLLRWSSSSSRTLSRRRMSLRCFHHRRRRGQLPSHLCYQGGLTFPSRLRTSRAT